MTKYTVNSEINTFEMHYKLFLKLTNDFNKSSNKTLKYGIIKRFFLNFFMELFA